MEGDVKQAIASASNNLHGPLNTEYRSTAAKETYPLLQLWKTLHQLLQQKPSWIALAGDWGLALQLKLR